MDTNSPAVGTRKVAMFGALTNKGAPEPGEVNVGLLTLGGRHFTDANRYWLNTVCSQRSGKINQTLPIGELFTDLEIIKWFVRLGKLQRACCRVQPEVNLGASVDLVWNCIVELGREPLIVGEGAAAKISVAWRRVF